jgi:hypothetical protein
MRIWLRALGIFVVITFLGMLMDRLLLTEGIPRFDLLLISNALVGGVAAGIGGRVDIPTTTASGIRFRRMRVIAEMNHHIRNALQVIQFSTRNQSGEAEVKAMRDAVQRITWALREVLPQLMNAEDSRLAWEIKDPEQTEVYRRPPAV